MSVSVLKEYALFYRHWYSYQTSSHSVDYLTFIGAGVCVEGVPLVTQTVDYLALLRVCVQRVPLVTDSGSYQGSFYC